MPLIRKFTELSFTSLLIVTLTLVSSSATAENSNKRVPAQIPNLFIDLLTGQADSIEQHIQTLDNSWVDSMVPMAIETLRFSNTPQVVSAIISMLERRTGQKFGRSTDDWYGWWWAKEEIKHPYYATFKSRLYRHLDTKFGGYFSDERQAIVRLDEIRWGGVLQDGIPPLREPEMLEAHEANYLSESDVVFGIELNGDARAYPKRILAWHEMFVDRVGNIDVAGVYCTLCGAVILYKTVHDGIKHEMGTSGFLYRSNKVMYDKDTQSLWSTTRGEPIVGPLVGKGIQLQRSFVVTTTWGEWLKRHPETSVLSLETGHQRNYDEGVAYKDYFATDSLMFTVPKLDNRLANKAEILALYFPQQSEKTAAISAEFLARTPVYHHEVGSQGVVIITDNSGANRVYDAGHTTFKSFDGVETVVDTEGNNWVAREANLTRSDGRALKRLPAHRAFWFGWYAVFNDTELIY